MHTYRLIRMWSPPLAEFEIRNDGNREKSIVEKVRSLAPEQQQAVQEFVELLEYKAGQQVNGGGRRSNAISRRYNRTAYRPITIPISQPKVRSHSQFPPPMPPEHLDP